MAKIITTPPGGKHGCLYKNLMGNYSKVVVICMTKHHKRQPHGLPWDHHLPDHLILQIHPARLQVMHCVMHIYEELLAASGVASPNEVSIDAAIASEYFFTKRRA